VPPQRCDSFPLSRFDSETQRVAIIRACVLLAQNTLQSMLRGVVREHSSRHDGLNIQEEK
jgi:hypothetical protein